MQYTITLPAGVEVRQEFSGSTLVLLDLGSAAAVDMEVEVNGVAVETFRNVRRGLQVRGVQFSGARFRSAVAATIEVIASRSDIAINYTDGATVNAVIANLPLPVQNDRGTPGLPMVVSGLLSSDTPAAGLVNNAPVTVTAGGQFLLAPAANRKRARFANIGANPVAIGATGLTWANRCIVLQPGDLWTESDAANLQWVGITDAGTATSVTTQEVLS